MCSQDTVVPTDGKTVDAVEDGTAKSAGNTNLDDHVTLALRLLLEKSRRRGAMEEDVVVNEIFT